MWEDLESRVGEQVTLTGTALNAALGAIVSLDEVPVYVAGLRRWPEEVTGHEVDLTGRLVFRSAPDPEGPVVHKPGDSYAVRDASWTLHGRPRG